MTLPVPLIVCFSIFSSSQIFEVNLIDKRSDKHGAPCLQVFLTSTYPTLDRQPAISDHLLGWFLSIDPSWWQDSLVSLILRWYALSEAAPWVNLSYHSFTHWHSTSGHFFYLNPLVDRRSSKCYPRAFGIFPSKWWHRWLFVVLVCCWKENLACLPTTQHTGKVTDARYFAGLTALVPPDRAAHVLSYKVIHFKLIVKRLLGKGTKKMAKKENMYFT